MFILLDTFLDIFYFGNTTTFRPWRKVIAVDAHGLFLRAMRDEIEARRSVRKLFFQRDHHLSRLVAPKCRLGALGPPEARRVLSQVISTTQRPKS